MLLQGTSKNSMVLYLYEISVWDISVSGRLGVCHWVKSVASTPCGWNEFSLWKLRWRVERVWMSESTALAAVTLQRPIDSIRLQLEQVRNQTSFVPRVCVYVCVYDFPQAASSRRESQVKAAESRCPAASWDGRRRTLTVSLRCLAPTADIDSCSGYKSAADSTAPCVFGTTYPAAATTCETGR